MSKPGDYDGIELQRSDFTGKLGPANGTSLTPIFNQRDKMTNIKLPSDKKSCSLYLSEENLALLNLLALNANCSQSKAASVLIGSEVKYTDEIVSQISKRLFLSWKNSKQNFDHYLKTVGPWLSVKKISPEHIERIVNQLRTLHAGSRK